MRILDRYILKSVISLFLGCLLIFLFLYIIIDVFSHLDEILRQKVGFVVLLQYYLSYLPMIFIQVSPMACLLSTLYTFGKLNRNNEVIAMRASGLSVLQISKTVILFGMVVSVLVFLVSDKLAPQSLILNEKIKVEMEGGLKRSKARGQEIYNNVCMYGLKNRLFFVNKFNIASETMEGIIILEQDEKQNVTRKIVANKGVYSDGLWRFYQCITYIFDENGQVREEPRYMEEEIMAIPETPREFLTQRQQPDYMTIAQIEDYIWKLSKSGALSVTRNLKVDLYQRFTMPLTSLIIILLGIPFALRMKKRATGLSSIGISIMMGFLYYVFSAVGIALGKAGILIPALAASLSHIIAFSTALYFLKSLP